MSLFLHRYVFVSLAIFCCQTSLFAQDETRLAKNVIHTNIGFLEWNINYERQIADFEKSAINFRLGAGAWTSWGGGGDSYFAGLTYLLGKFNHHLEANLGYKYQIDYSNVQPFSFSKIYDTNFMPLVNVGYRYKKPSGGFVFRIGAGTESFVNLGIGYAF